MASDEKNPTDMELFPDMIKVSADTKKTWKDMKEMFQAVIHHDMMKSDKSSNDIEKEISEIKEFFDFIYADSFSRDTYEQYAEKYVGGDLSWVITEIDNLFNIGISSDEKFVEVLDRLSKKYINCDDITESVDYLIKTVNGDDDHVFNHWEAFGHAFGIVVSDDLDSSDRRAALYCQKFVADRLEQHMASKS